MRQPSLVEGESDDGGEDAQEYVDGVVVTAVDRSPPDAEADDSQHRRPHGQLMRTKGVETGDGAVGCVQGWYGSENVRVVDVDAPEDRIAHERIEADEACCVAAGVEERFEAELLDVPGWGSRMDVVTDETDEVDKQETCSKAESQVAAAAEEQVEAESHGQRNPTQIKHSGQEIGRGRGMEGTPFVWRQSGSTIVYAEQSLFRLVDALNIYVAEQIVRIVAHGIVDESK